MWRSPKLYNSFWIKTTKTTTTTTRTLTFLHSGTASDAIKGTRMARRSSDRIFSLNSKLYTSLLYMLEIQHRNFRNSRRVEKNKHKNIHEDVILWNLLKSDIRKIGFFGILKNGREMIIQSTRAPLPYPLWNTTKIAKNKIFLLFCSLHLQLARKKNRKENKSSPRRSGNMLGNRVKQRALEEGPGEPSGDHRLYLAISPALSPTLPAQRPAKSRWAYAFLEWKLLSGRTGWALCDLEMVKESERACEMEKLFVFRPRAKTWAKKCANDLDWRGEWEEKSFGTMRKREGRRFLCANIVRFREAISGTSWFRTIVVIALLVKIWLEDRAFFQQ